MKGGMPVRRGKARYVSNVPGNKEHWEAVHRNKAPHERSWFAPTPATALALIDVAGIQSSARVIDVGGGTSRLVDALLERGFEHLTVLDIAGQALAEARSRVADPRVAFIEADVTSVALCGSYDLWHDRAVFHFLTDAADRAAYARTLRSALAPGGHVIIATFALDGPAMCSGLPVVRYEPASLARELGEGFRLEAVRREAHVTPAGKTQQFVYCLFEQVRAAAAK